MVTRTQLDRLTSRIEKLATELDPEPTATVPLYHGETEQEALAAYEEERGSLKHCTRIEFNRARPGETRAECMLSGMHGCYCMSPDELGRVLKEIDGKTRGLPAQYNVGRFAIPKPARRTEPHEDEE